MGHFDILPSVKTDFYCKTKETRVIQDWAKAFPYVRVSSENLLLY